jgi:prolyl 4-hydroxylase
MSRLLLATLFLLSATSAAQQEFGVDCSFPMQHKKLRCDAQFADDRQQFYEDFMQSCRDHFDDAEDCDSYEQDRIQMSLYQPQSIVNFTSTGFTKMKAPTEVMELLYRHWEANKDNREEEEWDDGNVYVNFWESPTYIVDVENRNLRGAGEELRQKVWDAARKPIEEWTGMELRPTSLYGIRIYTEGAVLSPHVDRLPLVSSCIVNVAQDLDEPWPLEVIDRHGNAVNVTMEPGDMVLYESASLIHGRPYPLKGRFFANIFIHFEPTGKRLGENEYMKSPDGGFLPPYLVPDSPWVERWIEENPNGWRRPTPSLLTKKQPGSEEDPNEAAANGDIELLKKIAAKNHFTLRRKDANGWQSIHEAARAGHKDIVELLIKYGVDKNVRTGDGDGSSPLNVALDEHNYESEIVQYLLSIDAEDIDPSDSEEEEL